MSERAEDFFVVGGTMRPQAASYIRRPADNELFNRLLAGEFCYVLTARQMGKSSLMLRTARHLAERGVRSVVIDLTAIGTVAVDAWYLGLLSALRMQLRLGVDPATWWAERAGQSAPQRFRAFLRDIVLAQIDAPLVVFIDEIDMTLALPFRDDFFAAIRAMFNEREGEPAFQRLTFVLLGVAAPTDLMKDQARTPFNIGQRIELGELSLDDAAPLSDALEALFPRQGDQVLSRVFHWTSGHPYLTQKLCAAAAHEMTARWDAAAVDALVARNVLDERAGDENLKFVQNRVRGAPEAERRAMLRLYQRVYRAQRVPDDDRSIVQNRLELTGLVKASGGTLNVRNEIYRRAFDQRWITATLPPDRQRRTAIGAALIAALLVVLVLVAPSFLQQPTDSLAQGYMDTFVSTLGTDTGESHTRRLDSLYQLFGLNTYNSRQFALSAFYDRLTPKQQQNLFKRADASDSARMTLVVQEIAATLGADGDGADRGLLTAMADGLDRVSANAPGVTPLKSTLRAWREGRAEMIMGKYSLALQRFDAAERSIVDTMPALLYDRAIARAHSNPPDTAGALRDLDTMLALAAQQVTPVPATNTPGSLTRTPQMPTAAIAHTLTPGSVATPDTSSPDAGPTSDASGDADGLAPTVAPEVPVSPDALANTRHFRNHDQIRATVSELLLREEEANLREAYRATLGSQTYARLEQAVASLPPLPPSATPEPPATALPTILVLEPTTTASDSASDGQPLTPPPPPPPQALPRVTPAAGLRPEISDVVDVLRVGSPGPATRPVSNIDTIIFRVTESLPQDADVGGLTNIQAQTDFFIDIRGFPGFPYHFVIDRNGVIYQTNRLQTVSPHTANYNQRGVGIALVTSRLESGQSQQTVSNARITPDQQRSAAALGAWLLSERGLPTSAFKDRSEVSPSLAPTGLDYTVLRADVQRLLDDAGVTLPKPTN